jgi:DNA excision repair protein ERCC-5
MNFLMFPKAVAHTLPENDRHIPANDCSRLSRSSEARKRSSRWSHSLTPDISENGGESNTDIDAEKDIVKKRRKTEKTRAESGPSTRKTAGRSRGRGKGRGAYAARTKKVASTETVDNEEDEDEYVGDSGDVVGFAPQLRPRPKRKLAHKGEVGSESDTN